MHTLILQISIKQWDKSQRDSQSAAARATAPNCFKIVNKPEFLILENQCLIDQHTVDFISGENPAPISHTGRNLKKAMLADGSVKLDRFIITKDEDSKTLQLSYQADKEAPLEIGSLAQGWIQAQYQWRHRVEKENQIFWLYEEVTLNAVVTEGFEKNQHENVFIESTAKLTFIAPEES